MRSLEPIIIRQLHKHTYTISLPHNKDSLTTTNNFRFNYLLLRWFKIESITNRNLSMRNTHIYATVPPAQLCPHLWKQYRHAIFRLRCENAAGKCQLSRRWHMRLLGKYAPIKRRWVMLLSRTDVVKLNPCLFENRWLYTCST